MVLNIVLGIIGLGIVIVVHETGHFLAAKLSGITVEAFSIGWGKVLFKWKRRETEYRISLLPIGGYCKMKGGDIVQKAWEEKKETIPQEEGSYYTASPLKRIFVSFSGPAFNLVFAFLVFSLIWGIGFTTQSYSNRIVLVSDYGEPGAVYPVDRGGFRTGDKIIEIDGTPVRNYSDIKEAVAISPGEELSVLVERNGLEKRLTLVPEKNPDTGIGMIGIYAWVDPIVGDIVPGSSAALAGLQPGDIIVFAGTTRINHTIDLLKQLDSRPERLRIRYERNGTTRETTLFIPYQENGEPDLGIVFKPETYRSADVSGFLGAFRKGFEESAATLTLTVKSLGMLFSGINVREAVSGPIRLTYYVGAIASAGFKRGIMAGFTNMFRFLSLLSVFFFFMNLLPIPALDGGHIVLHVIESITKRKPKPALIYRYQIIGFTIIIGILIFSTFNDVSFFLGN